MTDEEIGGIDGMAEFIETDIFKKLKVGFALDEGYANPTEKYTVFYGERTVLWVYVKCPGQPGHGSQFLPNTAGEKLQRVINSFLNFRSQQKQLLKEDKDLNLGDVTSVNLTMLQGGVQFNVVPSELCVGFDVRVTPTIGENKFEDMIKSWCKEAGDDVTYEFKHIAPGSHSESKDEYPNLTCVEDGKNPWWDAFSQACKDEYVLVNIPALGFSPMNKTPILLHHHNEFLNEKIFMRGVEIYTTIIPTLANLKI
ncbi:Aminoacylase-1-like 3 [Homarus americanus]|uniref:Aminoacylase-1-like 3 n=1 Tax=Homarus americanus TaxID=6706 RepID=A0A8J5JJR6_HOMAM|nr:Aminoacylase-1-like 3 [Homarus americanus]